MKIMESTEAIEKICHGMDLDVRTIGIVKGLHSLDKTRFDENPNAIKDLLHTFIGMHKGAIAFDIYKSLTQKA